MRIRFRGDLPSRANARTRQGRAGRERVLAEKTMRLLRVLPLTEEVLTAALRYDRLSFEDAQVAAAGELAGVDAILTNDDGFIKGHGIACKPQDLMPVLEEHLGSPVHLPRCQEYGGGSIPCRNLGSCRQMASDDAFGGFQTRKDAERLAGLRQEH